MFHPKYYNIQNKKQAIKNAVDYINFHKYTIQKIDENDIILTVGGHYHNGVWYDSIRTIYGYVIGQKKNEHEDKIFLPFPYTEDIDIFTIKLRKNKLKKILFNIYK